MDSAAFEELLQRIAPVKEFLAERSEGVPYLGGVLRDLPVWVYGVVLAVLGMGAFFTGLEVLLHIKKKALATVQGSSLGAAKEKRRIVSEAKRLARRKNYARAAELYLGVNEDKTAAQMLENGGLFAKAGQIYEKLGELDHAVSLYERAGEHAWLAEALVKKGEHLRAAETYLKAGKKILAAEAYEKAGADHEAAALFEDAGHTISAASHYEKAGNFKKAALLYERAFVEGSSSQEAQSPERVRKLAEYSMKAGTYYARCGEHQNAADAFARCKAYREAGDSSLAAGHRDRAAEYFAQGKDFERAAAIYREDGNTRRAAEVMAEKFLAEGSFSEAAGMYLDAGDFMKAAELYEQDGRYDMAGEAYMRETEYGAAAEAFIKGGDELKAAVAYTKAGNLKRASEIYLKAGDAEKATALIEESGDFVMAAELYRKLGQPEKELAALQKVPADDPRYISATARVAETFKAAGNLKLAAEKYLQAIGGQEADLSNIELHYGLGTVYEAARRYDQAVEAYRKVQLADFRYKDVEERIGVCSEFVTQSMAAGGDRSSAGQKAGEAEKRYSVLQEIGRGGMGVVYKARDNNLNRIIALKLLPKSISDNPKVIKRFVAEARSAAQLNHTNIVTLYDFHQAGGRSFITMEFVEGVTLKKLMGMVDKLPLTKVLKIIYQCCQGLDYAHRQGIIHRDIKPSNIMISKQNIVKIMDFGLAKVAGEETISEAGTISGTVLYMSPEQLKGEKLDRTTDIYSLGLVLYELAAGVHPFAAGDPAYHHVHSKPKPPKELRPDMPENLNAIILKCLEKDRTKRFESAVQLAQALREVPLKT